MLAGGLVVADGAVRRAEVDRLLQRVDAAQRAEVYADRRLSAIVEYVGVQMGSPSVPAPVRAELRRVVEGEARGQLPALRDAQADEAAVRVLPWHRDVRRARAAAVRLLAARVQRLGEVSADVDRLYERLPEPDRSEQAARAALTRVAGAQRVELAFAPRPSG